MPKSPSIQLSESAKAALQERHKRGTVHCDCEASECSLLHSAGNCHEPVIAYVRVYGRCESLCSLCLEIAQFHCVPVEILY